MPVVNVPGRLIHSYQQVSDWFVDVVRSLLWPKAELVMRGWVAKIFIGSAMLKLASLSTVPGTYLEASIELIAGVLLAIGALTRVAAIVLLFFSLALRLTHKQSDNQLFWMALFIWYAVSGADRYSIDRFFSRGLKGSAVPGLTLAGRLAGLVTANVKPLVLSILRVGLGIALLSTTTDLGRALIATHPSLILWIPTSTASILPTTLARSAGILLLVGVATRYVAVAIFVALFLESMIAGRMLDMAYLFMVFGILFVDGPGSISLDRVVWRYFHRYIHRLLGKDLHLDPSVPRVVIVGAGFGGISCVHGLRNARVIVTLIDRTNYHLFQPLLYQVATAALSPADIAAPLRPLFREMRDLRCMLGAVTGIDTVTREVVLDTHRVPYDFLVVATGATHSYLGNEHWADAAPGLKRVENALDIRRRILTAFELAESATTPAEQRALLTFLIVGGGPTGVELAGAIAELAKYGMSREFRTFDPASARVILVHSGPAVLPTFAPSLSKFALASLQSLGVEVLLNKKVQAITNDGVTVDGVDISVKTVLWAAGVAASPAARWLAVASDKAGRVVVGPDLSVPGLERTYAIGDTAASNAWGGKPVPGLAPAAKQGGAYVAEAIKAALENRGTDAPFRYRHLGSLATIGRKAAVADFGLIRLWGAPAWWLWGIIHVGSLVGARNRVSTLLNWFWAYLTFGGGARLTSVVDARLDHPVR